MKKNFNTILISGLALFSMFFGAGNLIFPPTLGLKAGDSFIPATIGFLISSVGIVLLSAIATIKSGGSIESIAGKVNKKFATVFGTIIILAIGPLLAIPRTAATTYEIVQGTILPGLNPIVSSIVFFAVVLFFVLYPKSIIDSLGKILTPALLAVLGMILIKGILNPIGYPAETNIKSPFSSSFIEGYQTMDALAALIFTSIISRGFINKGITDKKEIVKSTIYASLIAGIGLSIVYSGLLYIGSTMSGLGLDNLSRVELLILATEKILGNFGKLALSVAITLACLTTAIGLTSTVGDYFEKLTHGKIKAFYFIIASTIFSAYLSISGVDNIISFAGSILSILYPIAIVLVVLNLFPGVFKNTATFKGAVTGAFITTILQFLSNYNITALNFINEFGKNYPNLNSFIWIVPAILMAFIFTIISRLYYGKYIK